MGRCSTGVAKALSTTETIPCSFARLQTACRTTTSIVGLASVSKKKTFVFGLIAAFHASLSRASTQVGSIPKLGSKLSVSQRQEPNSDRPATEGIQRKEL